MFIQSVQHNSFTHLYTVDLKKQKNHSPTIIFTGKPISVKEQNAVRLKDNESASADITQDLILSNCDLAHLNALCLECGLFWETAMRSFRPALAVTSAAHGQRYWSVCFPSESLLSELNLIEESSQTVNILKRPVNPRELQEFACCSDITGPRYKGQRLWSSVSLALTQINKDSSGEAFIQTIKKEK